MPDDIVQIVSLGHGGEGLCRVDGAVVLVPGALPGDAARLGPLQKSRGVHWAPAAEIVHPSPHRIQADCPVFGDCGGCNWLNFAYPAQAEWKRRIVEEAFRRIARLDVQANWAEDAKLRTRYRTRATFHACRDGWGFYARGSHTVVPIQACPLGHPRLNDAFARLRPGNDDGDITITVDPEGDEILVWSERPQPGVHKVFPNAQSEQAGGTRSSFEFDGVPVVNGTFSQSSLLLNRVLRWVVDSMLESQSNLLDLYCGSGNFSLHYAHSAEVVGIDSNGPAVMAAFRASGSDYRIGTEKQMVELIRSRKWDTVMLDPPRNGAQKVAKALQNAACERVVYVSCDPATLARDCRSLLAGGWKLSAVCVVDMFPNTPHIESVCQFRR